MRSSKQLSWLLALSLCCVLAVSGAPDQQLTVYTAQASYSLPIHDRGGKSYIIVTDLLSPLGASPPVFKGREWRFVLNNTEVRVTEGKDKASIHGQSIDLGGKVLVEERHVMVPLDASFTLLSRMLNTTIDFHRPARRIFVGNVFTRFNAEFKNGDQQSLVLNFTQPVRPADQNQDENSLSTSSPSNKTTLRFVRDPLVSDLKTKQFSEGAIQSLSFFEENGAALLTVTGNRQLQIVRSEDGKTITLQAPAPQVSAGPLRTPAATSSDGSQKKTTEFFVMIDPAHGGSDKGASVGGRMMEKDITLRLARELRKELELRGIAARLLRETDIDLSLDRRAEITNEQHAGLYIALHAAPPGKGVRVYSALLTDPQQPATGRFVPWENAQAVALGRSKIAARAVSDELRKKVTVVTTLAMPVRPLNNIAVPAIAVELAPDENGAQSFGSSKRQNDVAEAIASGIAQVHSQVGGRP